MRKILAIDIGNTNITVGSFDGLKLVKKEKIPTSAYSFYKRISRYSADEVIISSVVPLALARIVYELNRISKRKVVILGKDIKVPVKNLYRNKDEVGQDRLVNAFGARAIYGSPAVIIDFGTAITFDIISKNGSYLGGLILPGIEMGLRSLYEKTALLPKVELKPAKGIIGKDTVDSMRGGILFGYGAMCDSLILKYRALLGRGVRVIATGGNAKLIKRYARSIQIVDEDLTLKSLALIRP
ncbi:MAG: type III pantothenate kinase [Candidatus Omnitrophica bacterium]|nr:type III pantothenate kinase [Candidatus Omnitrophota bacterium]